MKKTLIVTKDLKSRGGVANYYRLFFRAFKSDSWQVQSFIVGRRAHEYYQRKSRLKYIRQYLADLAGFFGVLAADRTIRIVQFNPSMIPVPLVRDGLLLLVANLMGRKTILFIRGWDEGFVENVHKKTWLRKCLMWICGRADRVVVLAERFKTVLRGWGVAENCIQVSRTAFDGSLVRPLKDDKGDIPCFLFLSRISEPKGVFEIVKAAARLKQKGFDFNLRFVGFAKDTGVMERLKHSVRLSGIEDITFFKGFVDGKEKYEAYADADVFLLPSWAEGCPNSVLEAMASGLFVICTDVGALKEVVKEDTNGLFVRRQDASDLAEKMGAAIENIAGFQQLGMDSRAYAFENFESEKIVSQFRTMYLALDDNEE